jgi:hypothetical protein
MPAPSSTLPLSLALAGWWLPVLGLLLAGLGAALVAVALEDLVAPVRATRSIAGATVAVESIVGHAVLTAPVGRGIGAGAGAGAMVHLVPGQRERPANCLGADLATGRRPESAHLATVPLQRPADCGDARDAITALATLRHASRTTDADSQRSSDPAEPHQGETTDLVAAALYGPPDRQPQATQEALLEEGVPDGGRGQARDYLEETAATRLLVP